MKKLLITVMVGAIFCTGMVFPGGGPEETPLNEKEAVVPVTSPEGTDVSMMRKQLLFPAAACFAYAEFTQDKNNLSMKMDADIGAHIQRQEPLDNVDKTQVYQFFITLIFHDPETAGFNKRVSVAFTLKDIQKQGGIIKQPVQFALQQGIKKSRMKSGQARVSEISYKGNGRFTALVELM